MVRGTRIPVDLIADMLAQGANVDEILEGYPTQRQDRAGAAVYTGVSSEEAPTATRGRGKAAS